MTIRTILGDLWRWRSGRQGSGYEKKLLAISRYPFPFDVYLLRYRPGAFIDFHTDPAPAGQRHFRCNIFLRHAEAGGQFVLKEGKAIYDGRRVQLFRPDITSHAVTRIDAGERLVLSIGWLWRS